MKKLFTFLFIFLLVFSLVSCKKHKDDKPTEPWIDENEPVGSIHMIKDARGNYGGTFDAPKYGEGAPLNGELDIKNSEYFVNRDYYYTRSTETRTILSKFRPYQQTMAKSDGIACMVMALNYYGDDIRINSEEVLVDKYEKANGVKVYESGTDSFGIASLFDELGYEAEALIWDEFGMDRNENWLNFGNYIKENLEQGNILMIRWQSPTAYSWSAVIGYDDMGTKDYSRDDVIILAEPNDKCDHYQDGYFVNPLAMVYRWWLEVPEGGGKQNNFEGVLVKPHEKITQERVNEKEDESIIVPEHHMIYNQDHSYGGTRDEAKYGKIQGHSGEYDHTKAGYYKMNDYYNMKNSATRVVLPNYVSYQQTMQSSCGIATLMSILNYFGEDITEQSEVTLYEDYEKTNNKVIKGVGTGASGICNIVNKMNYVAVAGGYKHADYVDANDLAFKDYETFVAFLKPYLEKGLPLPINWRPVMGHWTCIIGYDDMGTTNPYDDVLIISDSHDVADHYQDGYNTYNAMYFFRHWYNGGCSEGQIYYTIEPKK